MSVDELDRFVRGYAECAAWADLLRPDSEESGSDGYGLDDFTEESQERIRAECTEFVAHHKTEFAAYCEAIANSDPMGQAGHDFWLTRCGHGAGYWDRGLGELGTRLTDAAKAYGDPGTPMLVGETIELA